MTWAPPQGSCVMPGWWSSRPTRAFEEAVEKATSPMIPAGHEDLALNLEVCDMIRAKEVDPVTAMRIMKRRVEHTNANVQLLALTVGFDLLTQLFDLCIKNGGNHFVVQVASRECIDTFATLLQHTATLSLDVKTKILQCLQEWRHFALSSPDELGYIVEVTERLERQGFAFPPLDANQVAAARLFTETSTAPAWTDGPVCTKCRTEFTTFLRKHHCRNCGRVFCYQCSAKAMPMPWYGIKESVRVCDGCFLKKKAYQPVDGPPTADAPRATKGSHASELARALALSLQEAQSSARTGDAARVSNRDEAHEDDADLAAAIAASLEENRESAALAVRLPMSPATEATYAVPGEPMRPPVPYAAPPRPRLELASSDLDNVLSFTQAVLEPDALRHDRLSTRSRPMQTMYEKAAASRVQVIRNLSEGQRRFDELASMHDQLSDAVRMYDRLLDGKVPESGSYLHASIVHPSTEMASHYAHKAMDPASSGSALASAERVRTSPEPGRDPTTPLMDQTPSAPEWDQHPASEPSAPIPHDADEPTETPDRGAEAHPLAGLDIPRTGEDPLSHTPDVAATVASVSAEEAQQRTYPSVPTEEPCESVREPASLLIEL